MDRSKALKKFLHIKNSTLEYYGKSLLSSTNYLPFHKNFPSLQKNPKNHLFSFKIKKNASNFFKTLYGGNVTSLIELLTSFSLLITDKKNRKSGSIKLNFSFLKGCKLDTTIFVFCKVSKVGKNIGYVNCFVYNEEGEQAYSATCIRIFLDEQILPKL